MINFRSFPKIKTLLRTAALTGLLLNLQSIWGTDYTWTGGGGPYYTNWKTYANWTPSTGYPSSESDTAKFPGTSATTVIINEDIKIYAIQSHYTPNGNQLLTIDLNNHSLELTYRYLLVDINHHG